MKRERGEVMQLPSASAASDHRFWGVSCAVSGERVAAALEKALKTKDVRNRGFFAYTSGGAEPDSWAPLRQRLQIALQTHQTAVADDGVRRQKTEGSATHAGTSTSAVPLPAEPTREAVTFSALMETVFPTQNTPDSAPPKPQSKLALAIQRARQKQGGDAMPAHGLPRVVPRGPLGAGPKAPNTGLAAGSTLLVSSSEMLPLVSGIVENQAYSDDDGEGAEGAEGGEARRAHQGGRLRQQTYEEFMTTQKRAPRKGEMGITAETVAQIEALGYTMSGSSNAAYQKRIEAKQTEVYQKQADKHRLDFLAEADKRADEDALNDYLKLLE